VADPRAIFDGHEACDGDNEQWINALLVSSESGSGATHPGAGSFHPKARGHQALRDVVEPLMR